jgi:hypothetical protein
LRKEEEEICMQNGDSFYMHILGSKGGTRGWEVLVVDLDYLLDSEVFVFSYVYTP